MSVACPGRRTGRARARGHGGDWGLHFIEPRAGVDVLEDRSNALSRHGVGISRGYLLPKEKIKLLETRRWKRAKMSSKGDQESTRRGPLPHKYHKPAPARVWGSSSAWPPNRETAVASAVATNRLAAALRLWRARTSLGRGTRGTCSVWGKAAVSPLFGPWWGCRLALLGDTATLAPLGAVAWCSAGGGDLGFGSGALPVPKPRARRDWGFWCGVVLYGLDICRRGDANIRNWILGSLGLGFHRRRWASLPRAERVPSGSIIEVEGPGRIRGQGSSQC